MYRYRAMPQRRRAPRHKQTRIGGQASRSPLPSSVLAGSRPKLSRTCACGGGGEFLLPFTPEMGDTLCGFYDPIMLSANMGSLGWGGRCRSMLDMGGIGAGRPELERLIRA
jgi:hypothetical protein